jgi:EAL domain-containing protein (putative c-di-GMP-specific phosphodiesterase class I)
VVALLKSKGLTASDLELELAEAQLIDDFGIGYTSLSYWHRLPIECLKIDRSFVNAIAAESRYVNIAQTITILAHELGLSVVAEGVETSAKAAVATQ